MTEFDTNLPSIRQLQTFVKDKKEVEIKLVTDDLLVGHVFWQDSQCVCLKDQYGQEVIIWRQALVYLKPKP